MATILLRAAFAGYLGGTLAFLGYLATRRHGLAKIGLGLSVAALAVHTASYGTDCAVYRAMVIVTPRGMCSLLAFVTAALTLAIAARHRLLILGAFIMPIVAILAGVAVAAPEPGTPAVVLQGPLFPLHVWTTYLGFAGFTVAFGVAVAWLVQEREIRSRHPKPLAFVLPPLDTIERLSLSLVNHALLLTGAGIVTGVLYLKQTDGVWWAWEPKATATVACWGIYAAVPVLRRTAGWRGRRLALLLVAGFVFVVFIFGGLSHLPGPLKPGPR
ncbi:MAG: cytochrome c biogenesis protein CcsA [Candidatus Coatesbacteria bacterium]